MVAHEVGHAIYDFRPDTSSKETFIAEALSDEGEARLNQIKVQRDILKEKGVDIRLTGHPSNHGEYNNIYDQYFIDDDRDKARRDIGNIMADREIVSGSGGKTYRRHIGDEYDEWDRSRRR